MSPSLKEIRKFAENYVVKWCKEKRHIKLVKPGKGEHGFDFKDKDGKLFIEVKGTSATKVGKVLFRYLTDNEYKMAKMCLNKDLTYEIHLIVGINSGKIQHYIIPAKDFVNKCKQEVWWVLPIRAKDITKYKVT